MKKVILEEIENMKYLLGYKRGVVISEQEGQPIVNQDVDNSLDPKVVAGTTQPSATTPATWSPDPTGNKSWEYQFKNGKWSTRKIGQTKEYVISDNPKYASSVTKLNTAYPDAIKPVSTVTPTNTTPANTVVGGDASSEATKKTAEANASTGVASNSTPAAQNATQPANSNNFDDVDPNEFS